MSLRTRRGPVFTDLTFALPRGGVSLVAGRSGAGRSALMLAIAGRMRGLTGTLRVAGFDSSSQNKQIRRNVAVARIDHLVDLEGQLTVGDCITERALTDGVRSSRATGVFVHAERILDHAFDRSVLVDTLPALDRTLLSVALATLRPGHVLVLDDADRDLTSDELVTVLAALDRLAETGVTVIASVLDATPASAATTVVTLLHPSTPTTDAEAETAPAELADAEPRDESLTDETGYDEPLTDEPLTDEPGQDEPLPDETGYDDPGPDEASDDRPSPDQATHDQPTDDQPTVVRPTTLGDVPTTPASPASPTTPATV